MGKLVSFEKRRRPLRPKVPDGNEGQVVIFTGVRYERPGSDVPTNGTGPAGPKRKRG